MTESYSVNLKLNYHNTDKTRLYVFDDVEPSALGGIKSKVNALNASLAAGTAGGLSSFFVGDNGENLKGIIQARIISVIETPLDLGGGNS